MTQPATLSQNAKQCPVCQQQVPESARFCPFCGKRLVKDEDGGTLTSPAVSAARPAVVGLPHLDLQRIQTELPERYQVRELVGKGGMGVVYRCQDLALNRPVAIKLISDAHSTDAQAQRRFLREARAQAILNHPNVATILNVGVSPAGRPFLVMEYCEGSDLRMLLKENPYGLDVARVCDLGIQICQGLSEAHAAGIVHRDLKPSNVIVRRDHTGAERVKILDLGLAKIVGADAGMRSVTLEDTSKAVLGTPAYMSPEQINGQQIDARTDIYALGIVLFELFTGRLPFLSESVEGWLYQQVHGEPPAPSSVRPELARWPAIDSTVLWCLSKEPHVRPGRAEDAAFALRRVRNAVRGTHSSSDVESAAGDDYLPDEPRSGSTGMTFRPATGMAPSDIFKRPSTGEFLKDVTPAPNVAGGRQAREQFDVHAKAAEEAEREENWLAAIEHWRLAAEFADDRESVSRRIEALQREISFNQILSQATSFASQGDWARAEAALQSASSLRPADVRVEQERARMPKRLIEAWLKASRERLKDFEDPAAQQAHLRRLAIARARNGDMDGAILLLQEESRVPEQRIAGLAQAAISSLQGGHREGLRLYLDRSLGAAAALSDPAARGRACLELGRAMTAYGDTQAAGRAFQAALMAFLDAGENARAPLPEKGGVVTESVWGRGLTTTTRRLPRLGPTERERAHESALAAVAQAQAQAGLTQDALHAAGLVEDSWNRALILVQIAQALAKAGNSQEAERIAAQISLRLPKAKALRAVAVSRVFRGDMVSAEKLMREIASPEERAPILGFMSSAWARRGEHARASQLAREAHTTAMEVPGSVARIDALLNAAEPLLAAGQHDLGAMLVSGASRMVDGLEDPVERLHHLLRLVRLREKSRSGLYPALSMALAPSASFPELAETLRRAVRSLYRVAGTADRLECLEPLATAVASSGACDLSSDLLAQCANEMERAVAYVGFAAGMA